MNILIPIGGKGLRLKDHYSIPKPLIEVDGRTVIDRVLSSLPEGRLICVVRRDHITNYGIDSIISNIRDCEIIVMEEENNGQVETCLLAKDLISDDPLLIVNCDNYLVWDKKINIEDDGAALTFKDTQKRTHWCFAEVKDGYIVHLEEKRPISDVALAGAFYWKSGAEFVKYAEKLIELNLRSYNNEFYLGSVFNLAIFDGKKIADLPIIDMWSLGTPCELDSFKSWLSLKKIDMNNTSRNIQNAIDELRSGRPIVLVDEHDRENEGDIVIAAESASVENLVFTMNNAKGLMCIACEGSILDRLKIPMMVSDNTDKNQTPFTVSVDAAHGTSTGMSVYDRLKTISAFTVDSSVPSDLNRPGHLFPLRARDGLLKDRRGHTEGSVELMKLAGLKPVAIICEIINNDGTMAKGGQINKFAVNHGLTLISIEEIYESVYGESL